MSKFHSRRAMPAGVDQKRCPLSGDVVLRIVGRSFLPNHSTCNLPRRMFHNGLGVSEKGDRAFKSIGKLKLQTACRSGSEQQTRIRVDRERDSAKTARGCRRCKKMVRIDDLGAERPARRTACRMSSHWRGVLPGVLQHLHSAKIMVSPSRTVLVSQASGTPH